jgi:hypothetical protein
MKNCDRPMHVPRSCCTSVPLAMAGHQRTKQLQSMLYCQPLSKTMNDNYEFTP